MRKEDDLLGMEDFREVSVRILLKWNIKMEREGSNNFSSYFMVILFRLQNPLLLGFLCHRVAHLTRDMNNHPDTWGCSELFLFCFGRR